MTHVEHLRTDVNGIDVFYREAGRKDAPVLLLPHGYPCSSYEFRNLIPLLADRWRVIAPDFPGCGYSATPADFAYDFDGYSAFLSAFAQAVRAERFALYLHDFGTWIGLRLAMREPQQIAALIIQNGDIYEDELGPKYESLKEFRRDPSPEAKASLAAAVSEEGYREEFLNGSEGEVAKRIAPDLWTLHWALTTPRRREIHIDVIASWWDNAAWFPRYQAYLREYKPPTLIVWGPRDGYMPAGAAKAYLRDLPDAQLHLLEDAGHWLLETHLEEAAALMRAFLGRVHHD
ncbi:alpha/beta hydrolase [Steroidobacter sp. S1-65]|uniref:Alpha/beta hydrolase n=1 Tax=Steroidobacter gossypii TaxID=2805490 RepID=A0ABS1WV49_9GAMM|nr:alpha/beta hydrolase [Steroidobacter gossypii]MBM0104854.1 alpha/beta hydrolase [Steroidobacter gossypii]